MHLFGKLDAQSQGETPLLLFIRFITDLNVLQGGNLAGRCGYVWAATGLVCYVVAYFFLPEMKNRSYREIDILFKRKIPARKWTKTVIDVDDDE